MCDFRILGTKERNQKSMIMAAWFQVELNALIPRNLFCWKLSTCDLKFPRICALQPTQLALSVPNRLCGYLRISAVNSIKSVTSPLSFSLLGHCCKRPTGGSGLWVPRTLTLSQVSDHSSPLQTILRVVHWSPPMGQAWQQV